jgi:hypothetical protein
VLIIVSPPSGRRRLGAASGSGPAGRRGGAGRPAGRLDAPPQGAGALLGGGRVGARAARLPLGRVIARSGGALGLLFLALVGVPRYPVARAASGLTGIPAVGWRIGSIVAASVGAVRLLARPRAGAGSRSPA